MRTHSRIGLVLVIALGSAATGQDQIDLKAGEEAGRLADQVRGHPATASKNQGRHGLYLLDVDRGSVTMAADEPTPGLTHCGSARWSADGKRILFDATPGSQWNQAHLFAIDRGQDAPRLTDLGPGNCPSPSPDGRSIAFYLNPGAIPDAPSGLWIMNADGSGRRAIGSAGRPFWSPDNRRLLVAGFSDPSRPRLLDVETGASQPIEIDGFEISSIPSWVDATTLVAVLDPGKDDEERAIALVDITRPAQARIKQVLREKDGKPRVLPTCPVLLGPSRLGFFINANPKGMSLYSLPTDKASRPKRVERDGFDRFLADLAASPDGRFLLFCSDRPAPKPR